VLCTALKSFAESFSRSFQAVVILFYFVIPFIAGLMERSGFWAESGEKDEWWQWEGISRRLE